MSLFQDKYRSESHRLKNWDYSHGGIYFLTICAFQKQCLFGEINNTEMILNENGKIIENELVKSIEIRKTWNFHAWVIMPNHIHLLVEILENENNNTQINQNVDTHSSAYPNKNNQNVDTHCCVYPNKSNQNVDTHSSAYPHKNNQNIDTKNNLHRKPKSISSFVAGFKSTTTKKINILNNTPEKPIWQNNYYDHIVRNYESLEKIYNYIIDNPLNWENDSLK
jgi:REP element-mobilizing transposase RayT